MSKFIARKGWWFLKPGDHLHALVPVGKKREEIRLIRVINRTNKGKPGNPPKYTHTVLQYEEVG